MTIYTNKIIEHPLSGVDTDYHIAKTRWFQNIDYTAYDESNMSKPFYGDNYGYDYHLFQIGSNGEIYKVIHPSYFKYYGYYDKFEDLIHGFWNEERIEKEIYIPVISQSELALYRSRDSENASAKAVAIMRHGFGGHPLHKKS